MKKCEHFKEMILTQYIDGESAKDKLTVLEHHLLDCAQCRAFLKEVKGNAVAPFQGIISQPVPHELWSNIIQGIESRNQKINPLEIFIDQIRGILAFPSILPIFASFILMFLAGSITLNTIQLQEAKAQDQGEYLVSLLSPPGSAVSADNNDPGTPIEHYFL